MSTVLPFFAAQQALLQQLLAEGPNLHHALLLAGLPGIGKGEFARALAQQGHELVLVARRPG